jgi:FkbM family methyltransferase
MYLQQPGLNFMFKIRRRFLSYGLKIFGKIWQDKNCTFSLPDGSHFNYPLNSAIGRALFTGGFEIAEVEFMRKLLKPGDIVFDVGANGGLFTVIAAKKVGDSGHVYAFEPGERELELLRHNIEINHLKNVTVIAAAVGDKIGSTQLAISCDGALNSLRQTDHPKQQIEGWQPVKMLTLDSVIQEFKIPQVEFIKIDVEGAEKLVIAGANILLSSNTPPVILFESSDLNARCFGYAVRDLIAEFIENKYAINHFDESGYLTPICSEDPRLGKQIYNFIARKTVVLDSH